jgi:hypothetical protein
MIRNVLACPELARAEALGCLYSLYCREGVFSETHIQPGESLRIGTGGEPAFGTVRHGTPPQHLGHAHKYPAIALYQAWRVGYAADNMQPSSDSHDRPPTVEDGHTTVRRVTVPEAANILGVTPDAIRSRLRRGKLRKDTATDGTVLVVLDVDTSDGRDGQSDGHDRHEAQTDGQATATPLVEALQSQVDHLRRQLDEANRANAEHRRLLAAALERIPAIEAPEDSPAEPRESPVSASGEQSGTRAPSEAGARQKPVSWWRRFFGIDGHG